MLEKLEINNSCIPCDACNSVCLSNAIFSTGREVAIDNSICTRCGLCLEICPADAIKMREVKKV